MRKSIYELDTGVLRAINKCKKPGYVYKMRKVPHLGILLALLYAFLMSTAVAIVKGIKKINPVEVLVIRSFMQAIVFGALAIYRKADIFGHPKERWHLLGRATSGALNMAGWYLSASKISLMDSSTIYYSAPVFVGFLAFIFLKETFGIFEALNTLVTVIGVILISQPHFIPWFADPEHPMTRSAVVGLILALLASFTFALTNIHLRKLQKTATEVTAFWFSLATIAIGSLIVAFTDEFKMPEGIIEWTLIVLVGLCGIFGQISFALALKIEKAGPVSIVQTCTIVIVLIYQLTFFHEPVTALSLVGALLIIISVVLTGLKETLKSVDLVKNIKHITAPTISWNVNHSEDGVQMQKYDTRGSLNLPNKVDHNTSNEKENGDIQSNGVLKRHSFPRLYY
ncbi:solute carrier family 35 member G1-like protein [Dinothrombium tinctorium]|uniref:Solute carrier family 35 member G1-like protein n=1 Tax=Dinothrombium tinctorium TaxID=1965070 RepID=A0A3S3PKJ2_9ACAR|nr:solute carrier family 35 member G1-like protein [Dinothrombium tinctorium]RWS02654.1 solute carrier family 35 member G1-like protein [Dinothrombium tinctorium]RWS03147.1 solute carrier family 35 member G1-like protein [Dinothrombium tinctorium]